MNRKLRLKLNICRHLIACDDAGVAAPEDMLCTDVISTVAPAAGVHEIRAALQELETENRVIKTVGDQVRFSPTARARAFVAENA